MLPNMGGKNFYNGDLSIYANAWRTQYRGANCQNLTGWGLTPEGLETNEMLYELICDAGWSMAMEPMDVEAWKRQYAKDRYGSSDASVCAFLNALHSTVFTQYQDHLSFGWQGFNKTSGYVNPSIAPGDAFYQAMEKFLSADNLAKYRQTCPELLRYDIVEAAAFYVACRVEQLNKRITATLKQDKTDEARALVLELKSLMLKMDRLLTAHPNYDEQKWEDQAARMAGANAKRTVRGDDTERERYVRNARRIVTLWYGDHGKESSSHEPVNDYSCRVWAGLIRDYYLPRLLQEWENIIDHAQHNLRDVEHAFVNAASLSPVQRLDSASDAELMDYVSELVLAAKKVVSVQ